ncbi:MAG TPA: epoxide hydrolase [Chloroflexia bacterium]|nr:epoxide hydrolase [Chloroflexia bacterium]
MTITPFKAKISPEIIADLKERLARTRWPDEISGSGWNYGTNLAYLRELAAYWQNEFDWNALEAKLNQYPQYRAEINGFGLHFLHVPGKGPNPMPLLLSHGWPSTYLEFSKIIPLLTDPASFGGNAEDAFEVIAPSLPGYGFSDRPSQRGMSTTKMAELFNHLLT